MVKDALHAPRAYLSIANLETTQFLVVLEYVEGAVNVKNFLVENRESRKQFKNGEKSVEDIQKMDEEEEFMIMECVRSLARMAAVTWNNKDLLKYDYLIAADWIKGEGEEYFEKASAWNQGHHANKDFFRDENEFVTDLLEAQNTKHNFEDYVAEL